MEQLTHDRIQAEISKTLEDIENSRQEREKMRVEIDKMRSEVLKISTETRWHPMMIGAGLLGAGAAIATAIMTVVRTFA